MNSKQNSSVGEPVALVVTEPRRRAGMLRSLAGAAGAWRPARRGSFLVMVVGTLALLAVMAIIYSTIGNHDMHVMSAAGRRERLDDVPDQVRDYIAGLIADSTLAVHYDAGGNRDTEHRTVNSGQLAQVPLMRNIADYPLTDWYSNSGTLTAVRGPNGEYVVPFTPTGGMVGYRGSFDLTGATPQQLPPSWRSSTPFLAQTEPTFLNFNGSVLVDQNDATKPEPFMFHHDWLHLSNIAPDGRFVNLANLRNNWLAPTQSVPNPSGGPPLPAMSMGLTLFDRDTGSAQNASNTTDFQVVLDTNNPAHWDSRQVWLFRPARPSAGLKPSDIRFEPNQYADADGDGMYDSRWQELIEHRDPAGNNPPLFSDILKTDGKYRWFVATRIVDLSAMVNVNTAGDIRKPPAAHAPLGSSPTEIDLLRLLTMQELYDLHGAPIGPSSTARGGYDGIFQPGSPGSPGLYGPVNPGTTVDNTDTPPDSSAGYDQVRAWKVGLGAYHALRLSLGSGIVPPPNYRENAAQLPGVLSLIGTAPGAFNIDFAISPPFGSESSWNFGEAVGAPDPLYRGSAWATSLNMSSSPVGFSYAVVGGYYGLKAVAFDSTLAGTGVSSFTGAYTLDDLAELVSRRAVNDPDHTSALEMTVGGRDDSYVGLPSSIRFDPLRSNRGLDVEHDQRYQFPANGRGLAYRDIQNSMNTGDRNHAYAQTMLHFASDIRQRLTTVSGARNFRQLRTQTVVAGAGANATAQTQLGVSPDQLDKNELKTDPRPLLAIAEYGDRTLYDTFPPTAPALTALQLKTEAINRLFTGYCDALLPTSGLGKAWGSGVPGRMFEFYGHKGPELAIRSAAHMTLNLVDSYDSTGRMYHADLYGKRQALMPSGEAPQNNLTEPHAYAEFYISSGNILHYSITWGGLTSQVTDISIHGPAAPGRRPNPPGDVPANGIVLPLGGTPVAAGVHHISGDLPLTTPIANPPVPAFQLAEFLQNFRDGREYVEIKTTATTRGEVRGQIVFTGSTPTVETLLLSNDGTTLGRLTQANRNPRPTTNDSFGAWRASPPLPIDSANPLNASPMSGGGSGLRALELPHDRLGSLPADTGISAGAVNIYGIEAQPFITQVGSFVVYGDSDTTAGGDRNPVGGNTEVTLKGDLDFSSAAGMAANSDLMYQVVAFQLTNPFGVDIQLGGSPFYRSEELEITDPNYPPLDQDPNFYYIRMGNRVFKLASLEEKTDANGVYSPPPVPGTVPTPPAKMTLSGIVIPAGKTIVCYALSDLPKRILNDRIGRLTNDPTGDAGYFNAPDPTSGQPRKFLPATFKKMIEHHLGSDWTGANSPDVAGIYWVPEIDLAAGAGGAPPTGRVLLPDPNAVGSTYRNGFFPPGTTIDNVTLWHALRFGDEASLKTFTRPGTEWDGAAVQPIQAPPLLPDPNNFTNDEMVDRFRFPSGPAGDLAVHLPAGNQPVSGTSQAEAQNPALLYMVTLRQALHRQMNPKDNLNNVIATPIGGIPPYCIEPKEFNAAAYNWNKADAQVLSSTPNKAAFIVGPSVANFKGAAASPKVWYDGMTNSVKHLSSLDRAPNFLNLDNIGVGHIAGQNVPYYEQYPEIPISDGEFTMDPPVALRLSASVSTMRGADMLLPLAIGPEDMPFDRNNQPVVDQNLRYTTLGEALALSLGYQDQGGADATSPYWFDNTTTRPLLDRGNLWLDNYVSYFHAGNGAGFQPGDTRMGLGIPMALNVLDIFGVPAGGPESLTRPTQGLLNINTVALDTERQTLDMLSPPVQSTVGVTSVPSSVAGSAQGLLSTNPGYSAWTNPSSAQTTDGTSATSRDTGTGLGSVPIVLSNFGISIPAGKVILGVEVTTTSSSTGGGTYTVALASNNVQIGAAKGPASVGTTLAADIQGGPADTWGANLDVPTVTNANFGVILQFAPGPAQTASLDGVKLVVYYGDSTGMTWWWKGTVDSSSDMTAAQVSYRDKIDQYLRPDSVFSYPAGAGSVTVKKLTFSDTGTPDTPDDRRDGRQLTTVAGDIQNSGLREQQGFGSVGEMAIARARLSNGLQLDAAPFNIDFLGNDTKGNPPKPTANGQVGVDSVLYPITNGGGALTWTPGQVPNSYKEQLAVLNSVLGNVSTRSDYFVAWFVVAGFQQSDVTGLGPDDPMVPSVMRRFVMVVDRSKVTKRGDKPDIILFKEVPIDPQPH